MHLEHSDNSTMLTVLRDKSGQSLAIFLPWNRTTTLFLVRTRVMVPIPSSLCCTRPPMRGRSSSPPITVRTARVEPYTLASSNSYRNRNRNGCINKAYHVQTTKCDTKELLIVEPGRKHIKVQSAQQHSPSKPALLISTVTCVYFYPLVCQKKFHCVVKCVCIAYTHVLIAVV